VPRAKPCAALHEHGKIIKAYGGFQGQGALQAAAEAEGRARARS
jgi:hypothetical protein